MNIEINEAGARSHKERGAPHISWSRPATFLQCGRYVPYVPSVETASLRYLLLV
jgi:hypothetical protein